VDHARRVLLNKGDLDVGKQLGGIGRELGSGSMDARELQLPNPPRIAHGMSISRTRSPEARSCTTQWNPPDARAGCGRPGAHTRSVRRSLRPKTPPDDGTCRVAGPESSHTALREGGRAQRDNHTIKPSPHVRTLFERQPSRCPLLKVSEASTYQSLTPASPTEKAAEHGEKESCAARR
jgi:hypothetical protein